MQGEELAVLVEFLRSKNRKYSIEREDLLAVIKSMKGQYSLSDLFATAFGSRVIHAKSTLYRNIELFIAAGIIREAGKMGAKTLYTTVAAKHCNVATRGNVEDFEEISHGGANSDLGERVPLSAAARAFVGQSSAVTD